MLSAQRVNRPKKRRLASEQWQMTLLVLPGLLLFILFKYIPMFGVVIAFQDYDPTKGFLGSEWVGFENFEFFFRSQDAFRTIRNTVGYSMTFLVLDTVFAVAVALMLYCLRSNKSVKLYNTIMVLPRFMSMVLISFIVYVFLAPSTGVINTLRSQAGLSRIQWYLKANYWPFILTITHIWATVGMGCIIYYASLMGIDDSLFEAAMIDGANRMQQIRHVALPALIPIIIIQTTLNMGHIFSGDFGLFYQVPMNVGILYRTTDIINTYTYRALVDGNMQSSTAVGLFQSLVGLVMVIITNLIVRRISPENSLF